MIAQEASEASSRIAMTICTGTLASTMIRMTDNCSLIQHRLLQCGALRRRGLRDRRAQEFGQPFGPQAGRIDAGDLDARPHQQPFARGSGVPQAMYALSEGQ